MKSSDSYAPTSASLATDTDTKQREQRLLRAGVVLALALACGVALTLNLVDPDLWGHIRYAEDWLASGELPRTATHTFSASDHPWINHEILSEIALALGFRHWGICGLLVAKCLWGMAIVGLMVGIARRKGVALWMAWGLMLLVSANLHSFFLLRPQLISFGFFSLMLALLERAFRDWEDDQPICWRALWMLPPLFAVWANSHGAFLAGLCIAGALFGGRIVEIVVQRRSRGWDGFYLGVIGLSCAAATLVNPYGAELHRWLFASLIVPRPEITEWAAPSVEQFVFWPWVLLMVVVALSLATATRRRDWVKIVILGLVAWQSAMHVRHIAFLALLCGFWLPEYLHSASKRTRLEQIGLLTKSAFSTSVRRVAIVALLAVICWESLTLDRQMSGMPVSRNSYPLDAVQFMADRGLQGKLVVSFNWAQYAVAAFAPDVQVGLDGRFRTCYPQEVIDMHFDFLLGEHGGRRSRSVKSGAIDGTRVLKHGSPDLVLIDRRYAHAVAVMQAEAAKDDRQWVLLFCDRVAEIWGRRARYGEPTSPDYFPVALRVRDRRLRDGAVSWPALPMRNEGECLAGQVTREPLGG